MKKRGQAFFVGIMIAIMGIIVTFMFIPLLKDFIGIARDVDHLDCANTSISTGTKATCIVVDMTMFYFVGVCLGVAISYVLIKRFIQQDLQG